MKQSPPRAVIGAAVCSIVCPEFGEIVNVVTTVLPDVTVPPKCILTNWPLSGLAGKVIVKEAINEDGFKR